MTPHLLVVAKAPAPGRVKTRLAGAVGPAAAAEVAAASLLDTMRAGIGAFGAGQRHLALAGDLGAAAGGHRLARLLQGWQVRPQCDGDLGRRLAHAHRSVPGPVVQIGMDTPQVTPALLRSVARALAEHEAVLGPATDGGWWVLGLRHPSAARVLSGVPMSTPTTYDDTRAALRAAGLEVGRTVELRDVDEPEDADAVAALVPGTAFARAWAGVRAASGGRS